MSCRSFAGGTGGICLECAETVLDGLADFEDRPCEDLAMSKKKEEGLTRGALAQMIRAASAAPVTEEGNRTLQALVDDLGVVQILARAFPEKTLRELEKNSSLSVEWPK